MADEEAEERPNIVVDNGSGMIKAGFAGDDDIAAVFPNVVGTIREGLDESMLTGDFSKDLWIGDDAMANRGILSLRYPLVHGIVGDWDTMEKVWSHLYQNVLRVDISEHNVLLTEAALNPKRNRETMTKMHFETFGVPGMYVSMQAMLTLHANGRTTGLVLDCGDGVTHTCPVFEGFCVTQAVDRLDLAGRDTTEWMQKLLMKEGYNFTGSAEREIVRQIKEKFCFVAEDYDVAMKNAAQNSDLEKEYTLPNGDKIKVREARFQCPELLFKPQLAGREEGGVHHLINETIKKCPMDIVKDLYSNIAVSGGSTMFEGFPDRLESELKALAPDAGVAVLAPPERMYSVYTGAQILANLGSFQDKWITKAEYEDQGAAIVHKKCPR